jgi:hypothetical protein
MHAGFSFSYSYISLLLRQPLSIKKSYAGAIQMGIGKNSDMVGKIPPWKWDMVGKIPT